MKRLAIVILLLLVSSLCYSADVQKTGVEIITHNGYVAHYDTNYYFLGAKDALLYYNITFPHAVFGFFVGGFAVLGVALTSYPLPYYNEKLLQHSTNKDLIYNKDYIAGYTYAARKKNIRATMYGWGVWTFIFIIVMLI